jgi:hypothetical protein
MVHRYILGYRIYIYIWVCQILVLGSFWTNRHWRQIQIFLLISMIQVQVSQIVGCAHHEPTFSVWRRFHYFNWVVVIVKPTVAKQLLPHSWDWWFVTAKRTCFSIMCWENWYHQHIPGGVPFTPSYLQTNQNQSSRIIEIKTEEINYIAYLVVHKSTNAKDQGRDFCQSSDHVSIATDSEQQDWHKLELWLQLTCKCWQDWCSFTLFHAPHFGYMPSPLLPT